MDLLKLHLYAKSKKGSSGGGIIPSGELLINENGIYDVIPYASVNVEVSASGGGAEGETDDFAALVENSITSVKGSNAKGVKQYTFYDCSKLTTVDFPLATRIGSYAFYKCQALTTANFPLVTRIDSYVFKYCYALTTVNFPLVAKVGGSAFEHCKLVTAFDFPLATEIESLAFAGCAVLKALILRKETNICSLAHIGAFNNTPIANGTGYIYVPAALIDSYKAATNWSNYSAQFRALEDYTVDGTVTGALDESKI